MNACECANDETMVVETCDLINRCALPVDAWSENGGLMDGVVGQGSCGARFQRTGRGNN